MQPVRPEPICKSDMEKVWLSKAQNYPPQAVSDLEASHEVKLRSRNNRVASNGAGTFVSYANQDSVTDLYNRLNAAQ